MILLEYKLRYANKGNGGNLLIDKKKVKARMAILGLVQKDIAKSDVWNCSIPTVSQKLNHVRPITLDEADSLARLLRLNDREYYEFFFT